MTQTAHGSEPPLSILYLEDNPLIAFHVEQIIEDLGYTFAGSLESFADLQSQFSELTVDAALVDIDLADGSTGPAAAAWLLARGVPSIFVTGQDQVAELYSHISIGVVTKPIFPPDLARQLLALKSKMPGRGTEGALSRSSV